MPRSSGRLGAPNRQLEGFVIQTNRSSSSRNSQYGYAPSDPFDEVLERIPEGHAEKSDGTDNENLFGEVHGSIEKKNHDS